MDERILIPFTTMEKRFIGNRNWGLEFMIKAESFEKVEQAVAEVKIALRRRHGSEKHFQFFTAKEMLKQVGNVSRILRPTHACWQTRPLNCAFLRMINSA